MKKRDIPRKPAPRGLPFYVKEGFFTLRELRGIVNNTGIPPGEQAITSLVETPDGRIFGGTSGRRCHLFIYDRQQDWVTDAGSLVGENGILHSLVVGCDGVVYGGTGSDRRGGYPGGRLFAYDPGKEFRISFEVFRPAPFRDLGIPVKGESIICMTISPDGSEIYGLSNRGLLFTYSIESGKKRLVGKTTASEASNYIACDKDGNVYGSAENGRIFKYDRKKKKIFKLNVTLPGEKGTLDCWAGSGRQLLYGATGDGYIFKFYPGEERIIKMGRPLARRRVRGLTVANDGGLYGIGGDRGKISRLFKAGAADGVMKDLGMPHVNGQPKLWTGYEFDSMITGRDGTIYMGESDRISHLFLYFPVIAPAGRV